MWQKYKKYHLLLNFSADLDEGQFLQTACGNMLQIRRRAQQGYVFDIEKMCPVCEVVWRLCFTSVDDARQNLKKITNIKALERALEMASQVTLRKAIEVRIKALKVSAEKERKLRLIAKAYE